MEGYHVGRAGVGFRDINEQWMGCTVHIQAQALEEAGVWAYSSELQ